MRLLIVFCIAGLGTLFATVLEQAPAKAAKLSNPFEGREDARRAGAKLFRRECAACHGERAEGLGSAPPLKQRRIYNAPPGALFWVLRNGSQGRRMPSFAQLPEAQRWQLVTYVRSLR
jgi:mono/diheme cytochrome c family protein